MKTVSKAMILSVLIIALTSCNAFAAKPTETPTPTATSLPTLTPTPTATSLPTLTPTPEPTATPEMILLKGLVYFDMNGDSIRNFASIIYDPGFFTPISFMGRPELLNAILSTVTPSWKKGQIITIEEPTLFQDILICSENNNCVTPDANGEYEIAVNPDKINITVKDLAVEDNMKLRYVVLNKGKIQTDSNPEIGITPQILQYTTIVPLYTVITDIRNADNIGLIQGELTLPIMRSQWDFINLIQGFDHDPDNGRNVVLGYNGQTNACIEYYNCSSTNALVWPPMNGIGSNHGGIDFGYSGKAPNEPIILVASRPGVATNTSSTDGGAKMVVLAPTVVTDWWKISKPTDWRVIYGHNADIQIVNTGTTVQRGEPVAIMGSTGTTSVHVHLGLLTGKAQKDNGLPNPFYRDFFAMIPLQYRIPGVNDTNHWTVYNIPVFP